MVNKSQTAVPSLVLVIDDNEDYCHLLERVLNMQGHQIIAAPNGRQGLELFDQKRPHLVLLDYELPDMTGAECLEGLKEKAAARRSRIVIFSGHDSEVIKPLFATTQPDAFLQKPTDLADLAALLERHIQISRASKPI